jgi:glycosyltransferase involved in cell wall biosynthesis
MQKKAMIHFISEKNIEFDLIHAHFSWPSGAVASELKKYYNKPLVITHHARPKTLEKELNPDDKIFQDMWSTCDSIIRIKKENLELFTKCGISEDKIHYVPNGYEPKKVYPYNLTKCRNKLNIPHNKKVLITIANLIPVKGHQYAIEAISEIVKERNDILYYIIGTGPLEKQIKKQIKNLNLENYIELVGFVPNDELYLWLNACDIFLFPSIGEGFGIVQIEALACGKPVISTYNGGSEEIIISDEYGLLCAPENSKQLKHNINIALKKKWNSENIMLYANNFSLYSVVDEIIGIYEGLL